MIQLFLDREKSSDTETMGELTVNDIEFWTVEQEWRPTHPGGQPNNSCVPAGRYKLVPHTRPNGDEVVALVNHGLGVYHFAADRPHGVGRYLILLHAGNSSADVVGCIAPGLGRNGNKVVSSRNAMRLIMDEIRGKDAEIVITGEGDGY